MTASYTYYAANAFRWYFKNEHPEFYTAAYELNWKTCDRIVKECDPNMLEMIREVYLSADTTGDAVYETARKHGVHQDNIWTMLGTVEKRFARERGLI